MRAPERRGQGVVADSVATFGARTAPAISLPPQCGLAEMSFNTDAPILGDFEQITMLAVLRLDDDAYGVTIREEIERETSRELTVGAIYKTLGRLERKGYVSSRVGAPTPQRGGRRKKLYRVEPPGIRALRQSVDDLRRLTRGLGRALEAR